MGCNKQVGCSCLQGDIEQLEKKVIDEFNVLLNKLERGYSPDYLFILEQINLIELVEDFELDHNKSLFTLQYYLNNPWLTTIS